MKRSQSCREKMLRKEHCREQSEWLEAGEDFPVIGTEERVGESGFESNWRDKQKADPKGPRMP